MADAMIIELQLRNQKAVDAGLSQVQKSVGSLAPLWNAAETGAAKYMKQLTALNSQASRLKSATSSLQQTQGLMSAVRSPASPKSSGLGGLGGVAQLLPAMEAAEALAGPIGVAVAALKAMSDIAQEAARSITEFRDAAILSGATALEQASLNLYGKIAGVSDTAGAARSAASRISTDGAAAAFASNAGVFDSNSAFSALNKAKQLQKMLDYMTNLPHTPQGNQQAALFARAEALEPWLKLRDLSRETLADLNRVRDLNAMAHSPEANRLAAEFNAQLAMAQTNFDTLTVSLGTALLPSMTGAIKLFNQLAPAINSAIIGLTPLIKLLLMATPVGMLSKLSELIDMVNGALKAPDAHTDAVADNTAAIREHTAALKAGTYGGGERARGAIPSAWGGSNSRNWTGQTAALGAFTL